MAIYSDLEYQLKTSVTGGITLVTDGDSVKQSIKMILSTYPGERFMLPEFGSRLRELLFEQMDEITAKLIELEIKDSVMLWEDRIEITNLEVVADYDANAYDIYMVYQIKETNAESYFTGKVKAEQ